MILARSSLREPAREMLHHSIAITMKIAPAHHVRTISAQAILFGTAAVLTALLIITATVEQNVLALAGLTAVALAFVWPVEVSLGLFAVLVPFDQALVLGNSK